MEFGEHSRIRLKIIKGPLHMRSLHSVSFAEPVMSVIFEIQSANSAIEKSLCIQWSDMIVSGIA
jgi:hypothetical protein